MSNILSPKETAGILEQMAVNKTNLSRLRTALLGILAGMFIGFGAFAAQTISHSIVNVGLAKFAAGAMFPVGLMLVVIPGGELFTGNSLMVIGQRGKVINSGQMFRNWVIVYLANLVGSIIFAILISQSGLNNLSEGLLGASAIKTAAAKCSLTFSEAFIRGILCNILVVLAVWMATSSKDVIGKIFACWFPIMTFVMSGFEHSIANMYYIPVGILAKANPTYLAAANLSAEQLAALNVSGFMSNLIPVTLGNIIGGSIVIGLLYRYILFVKVKEVHN